MQVKTKTLIVGTLAVLMVGVLWYRMVYSPIKSKTSKANAAAHNSQLEADNLQKAIDDLTSTNKKNATQDIGTATMLQAVPATTAEASFLRSLDTIRVGSGADWQSVSPSTPTPSGSVTSINVSITVQGDEAQLARYLNGLYGMRRIFVADNVTLTQSGSTSAAGQPVLAPAGALFLGGQMQLQVSGRIFASAAPTTPASSGTGSTSTATGSTSTGTATTGGATAPAGVQNN